MKKKNKIEISRKRKQLTQEASLIKALKNDSWGQNVAMQYADAMQQVENNQLNGSGGGMMTGIATVGGTTQPLGGGSGAIGGGLLTTIPNYQQQPNPWVTTPNINYPNTTLQGYPPQTIGMMSEEQLDAIAGAVLKKVLKKLDSVKLEDRETLKRLLKGKI